MSVDTEPTAEEAAQETVDETTEAVEPTVSEEEAQQETEPVGEEEATAEPGEEAPAEEAPEGEAEAKPGWITDDVRALADSYGVDEAELANFESGADFHRACRLADQAVARLFQKEEEPPAEEPPAKEPPAKKGLRKEEKPAASEEEDLALDLAKYDGYDADTFLLVKAVKRLQEDAASRADLATINEQFSQELARRDREHQEAAVQGELAAVHEVLDGMDEDLFGGEGELTEELDDRRRRVWEAYRLIVQHALPRAQSGDKRAPKLPPRQVLVKRAAMLEFGDEMLKSQKAGIYRELHEQSRGRRPVPAKNKATGPPASDGRPKTLQEQREEILRDPDIAAVFNRAEEESGSAPQ